MSILATEPPSCLPLRARDTVVIGQVTSYPNVAVSFILKLPVSAYGL